MYREMGKYQEALAELQEGLRIARSTQGERSELAGVALNGIGSTL